MLMEVRAIGRKTPGDGRLEVTEATWRRLSIVESLSVRVGDVVAPATLERMGCTRCAGHTASGHDHLFVRSEAARHLVAGEHCALELLGAELVVARPHSLAPDAPR